MEDCSLDVQRLIAILLQAPIDKPFFDIQPDEPFMSDLLLSGRFWTWKQSHYKSFPGIIRECHYNASKYWREHKDTAKMVAGYAFDTWSGCWTGHTWCIEGNDDQEIIVEGFGIWPYYFGFVICNNEAEEFSDLNIRIFEEKSRSSQKVYSGLT